LPPASTLLRQSGIRNAPRTGYIFSFWRSFIMSEHRLEQSVECVHLTVEALPSDVAREIRECQVNDPDFLRRILLYGITHRVVLETLGHQWRG